MGVTLSLSAHPSSSIPEFPRHATEDSDIKKACHLCKLRLIHVGEGLKPNHSLIAAAIYYRRPGTELAVRVEGKLLVQRLAKRVSQLTVDATDQLMQDQGIRPFYVHLRQQQSLSVTT